MAFLPPVSILSYNGYSFDGSSRIRIKRTNVRDEADRTTTHVDYDITVLGIVASGDGSNIGPTMDAIFSKLTCEGGILTLASSGFGSSLNVNTGITKDVRWGPKPQMIMWAPIGSYGAAEIEWNCRTSLNACGTSGHSTGIMALNYEVSFDIDENGDTVRTISGYYQIAQTRVNNAAPCSSRQIADTADANTYRLAITPECPLGFIRRQSWKTSKDKCREDFTIVDRQIPSPNAYPANVTAISGKHRLQMNRRSLGRNRSSISCTITPNRGISGAFAWTIFQQIFAARKAKTEAAGYKILVTDITMEEDLFGRPTSFSLEYLIYSNAKNGGPYLFQDPLPGSALWTPLNTDWTKWRTSLSNSTFNNRGNAQLANDISNDVIVDLCATPFSNPGSPTTKDGYYSPGSGPAFSSSTPTPEHSYPQYDSSVGVSNDSLTICHRILQDALSTSSQPNPESPSPGSPITPPRGVNAPNAVTVNPNQGGASLTAAQPSLAQIQKLKDVIQHRGGPCFKFHVRGRAKRVGYPVPRPGVQNMNGIPAHEIGGWFQCRQIGIYYGQPVYAAGWDLVYQLETGTGNIQPPLTPVN